MIRGAFGVLFGLGLALGGVARADNPKLAAARRAVHDVRYDDARGLLVEALEVGTNRPDELGEIYQLSAATAVVLGQNDLAVQYYRRVLALDPGAVLPADASPRLRQPFLDARAYMAAQGLLDARAERHGAVIEVTLVADPLGMVAAVAASAGGAALPKVAVTGRSIEIEPRGAVDRIVLLDQYGNTLRSIAAPEPAPTIVDPSAERRIPIARRWWVWAAPAAGLTVTGVVLAVAAQSAKARLDDILAASGSHFLDDAEQQRRRWHTEVWAARLTLAAAGALTATAIVMAATAPSSSVTLTPSATARQIGLVLDAKF